MINFIKTPLLASLAQKYFLVISKFLINTQIFYFNKFINVFIKAGQMIKIFTVTN